MKNDLKTGHHEEVSLPKSSGHTISSPSREGLEEIRQRAERAEPWGPSDLYHDTCAQCERDGEKEFGISGLTAGYHATFGHEGSATFIAHSRTDILTLCDWVEELLSKEKDRTVQGGEEMPRRSHEFACWIGADTGRDLVGHLIDLAHRLKRGEVSSGVSGGYSSGSVYAYRHDPSITHDSYFAELELHLERISRPKDGPSTPDPQTRKGDWIPWNGGECPVPRKARVEYRMREFPNNAHASPADELDWNHHGEGFDILAYRPVPTGERT